MVEVPHLRLEAAEFHTSILQNEKEKKKNMLKQNKYGIKFQGMQLE
jgi:hypothetical protein